MIHRFVIMLALSAPALGFAQDGEHEGSLFENVVSVLQERYFNEEFRENVLPGIAEKYRERASAATTLLEQRQVTHEFLSNIPSSHLCLTSESSHVRMLGELMRTDAPTFGFAFVEYDGKHYAHNVLEGGPAERAGLRRGDRIVSVDGVLTGDSPRLDWRTDDAFLPDPPTRFCLGELDEVVRLHIERRPGKYLDIEVKCELYSAFRAAKASARIFEHGGRSIGYLHLWYIFMSETDVLLRNKLEEDFADCDAFVLDLRGRGGNGMMVPRILDILDGTDSTWNKPVVGLINGMSRSAKDVIAYELRERKIARLVGETTAGAVVPVSMKEVGPETHLMFPSFELHRYSDILEFVGVPPDVLVEEVGPYSAGRDPILRMGLREATSLANAAALLASEVGLDASATSPQIAKAVTEAADMDEDTQDRPHPPSAQRMVRHRRSKTASKDVGETTRPLDEDLPVATLLGKMVDALGGEEALRKHSAQTLKGKMVIGGMLEGALTIHSAAPSYFRFVLELQGMGTFAQGYDGQTGWGDDPQSGARILEGRELERARIQANYYGLLDYESTFKSIEVAGLRQFAGRECYELKLTDKSDNVEFMYVDPDTYLSAGSVGTQEGMMGEDVKVTTVNEEFGEFHGVKVATRSKQDIGGFQEQIITITDVSVEPLPSGTFDPPESIVQLLKKLQN